MMLLAVLLRTLAGPLTRAMVSCTGSQFCGFALSETKNRAVDLMAALEQQLDIPRPVRIHFTGCPNSCGQAQVRREVCDLGSDKALLRS
jgi:sulfite reductase beta subunit-like hemoprotein